MQNLRKISEPDNKSKLTSKLPARTRWGSVVACLKSLRVNKRALQLLPIDETTRKQFTNSSNIKANLLSDSFWKNLDGFVTILEPISTQITIIESDVSRISNVHSIFMNLENHFQKPLPISPFSMEERELKPLKSLVQEKNCVRPIHLAAALLDPRMCDSLTGEEQTEAIECIISISKKIDGVDDEKVLSDLASYQEHTNFFSK